MNFISLPKIRILDQLSFIVGYKRTTWFEWMRKICWIDTLNFYTKRGSLSWKTRMKYVHLVRVLTRGVKIQNQKADFENLSYLVASLCTCDPNNWMLFVETQKQKTWFWEFFSTWWRLYVFSVIRITGCSCSLLRLV